MLTKLTIDLKKKARLFSIAGDETRIRILCMMFREKEACVSEIADELDMSIASISHHLRIMKDNGLFNSHRMGNNICYELNDTKIMNDLKKIICD